jgi:transposase
LFIQPFLPPVSKRGRRPTTDLRDVLDALRYLARTGGGWRMLPNDFPPWQTVYWWFGRFVRRLLFRTIHDVALMLDREREDRSKVPPKRSLTVNRSRRLRRKNAAMMPARRLSTANGISQSTPMAGC